MTAEEREIAGILGGSTRTTGLESEPAKDPKDSSWWKDTISSGLGIIGSVIGSDEEPEREEVVDRPAKKVLGMPAYAGYTVIGVAALVGTVFIVRKIRK